MISRLKIGFGRGRARFGRCVEKLLFVAIAFASVSANTQLAQANTPLALNISPDYVTHYGPYGHDPYVGGYCGDGLCEAGETRLNCLADCPKGDAPPLCGNALCEVGEAR